LSFCRKFGGELLKRKTMRVPRRVREKVRCSESVLRSSGKGGVVIRVRVLDAVKITLM